VISGETEPSAHASRLELTVDVPIAPPPASAGAVRSARRLLRRKDRQALGEFLAEGRPAVSEALQSPYVRRLLVDQAAVEPHQDLLNVAYRGGMPIAAVESRSFAALADTVTPQGILAVCDAVDVPLSEALTPEARLVVLCDQVRDPGNLGTVIRCADAFGADAVLVTTNSVDLYNPKTVRATTGSLFHLPICVSVDLADAVSAARAAGLATYGADGAAQCTVDDLATSGELASPILWVFGNEAHGLSPEHVALLDRLVALPMYGRAESLNLSTAAAAILYATATAQR
jgi:TrmH family RNA methyltransferase